MPGPISHSNSAARAVAIVEFLATHPEKTLTATEIGRGVHMNKSTAYTIIQTLCESGWLFRTPQTARYGLGPTLIALGQAATEFTPHVSIARPVMRQLASELGRECVFSIMVNDEVLILDTTGSGGLDGSSTRPGQRTPCFPPFGRVFVAFQDEAAQTAWLKRGATSDLDRSLELSTDLEEIRERGFAATLRSELQERWVAVLQEIPYSVTEENLWQFLRGQLDRMERSESPRRGGASSEELTINSVHAPIFEDGDARYALTIVNINERLDVPGLTELGQRVRAASDEITGAIKTLSNDRRRTLIG